MHRCSGRLDQSLEAGSSASAKPNMPAQSRQKRGRIRSTNSCIANRSERLRSPVCACCIMSGRAQGIASRSGRSNACVTRHSSRSIPQCFARWPRALLQKSDLSRISTSPSVSLAHNERATMPNVICPITRPMLFSPLQDFVGLHPTRMCGHQPD